MKRNFLKLRSWAVIALIGSFTFTSCSDDDDNGGSGDGNEDEIVMENGTTLSGEIASGKTVILSSGYRFKLSGGYAVKNGAKLKIEKGVISNSAGKTVFDEIMKNGGDVDSIIESKGLAQNSDTDFIKNLVKEVFANNEKSINDYKNGKTNALGYLVGQCMKASKGKANPGIVKEIVTEMLEK